MIILASLRKQFTMLGFFPISKQSLQSYNLQNFQMPINYIHITLVIIFLLFYFVCVYNFVMTKAKTFAQYAEGTLFCIIVFTRLIIYFIMHAKKSKISAIVIDLEAIIRISMFT